MGILRKEIGGWTLYYSELAMFQQAARDWVAQRVQEYEQSQNNEGNLVEW